MGSDSLETVFQDTVQPFLQQNCLQCHDDQSAEGDLDLSVDQNIDDVVKRFRHWAVVLDRLEVGDMPPEDADIQPNAEQRDAVIAWIESLKAAEAKRTSGDPGMVLARRLSSAEYDRTIRDLTGVDIRPAADFPIDPANEAGFDNSGESLTMSPALLKKYLQAARRVAEHMAITPAGLEFAPHPVITETDRDKFCVNRIIDFYRQQNTRVSDHLYVVWKHHQSPTQHSLEELAIQEGVSARYCQLLSELLGEETDESNQVSIGPIFALRTIWKEVAPSNASDSEARQHCENMATFIESLREKLIPDVPNLTAPEMNSGSQSLVLWKNRQFIANRRRFAADQLPPLPELMKTFDPNQLDLPAKDAVVASMQIPESESEQATYAKELDRFCNVFPDQFLVSERARVYLDQKKEKKLKGRFLSAGFHSQMGYFRDDEPLCDLMLTDAQRETLDRLWLELDFVTSAPMRQYAGFIWFDRTDSAFMRDRVFDRYRAEDKDCISEEKVRGLRDTYAEKAERVGASPKALAAIRRYFDDLSQTFRSLEQIREQSEPVQLEAMLQFAERAYRRPLEPTDRDSLLAFYQYLRTEGELDHEESIRDCVVRILMSPHFCYRVDPTHSGPAQSGLSTSASKDSKLPSGVEPLDSHSLANRLSYFLWSSMPDETLMDLASKDRLQDPSVLIEQTGRMLKDDRSQGFLREFMGNWLNFRRFDQHNGVDRERFPTFTDDLRQSMLEEPLRFFTDVIQRDGSVLDLLYADHTFVNRELALHYGVDEQQFDSLLKASASTDGWIKLPDASHVGRGGLLPMGVFLTRNSPGLRTSPVQRGNWVVQRVLGEHVPAPPAEVPELPEDESKLGDLTIREALARHREHPSCAGCHERIDSMGLVFEGYGPVGEMRDADLGGRSIDASVVFPDGGQGDGIEGLRDYIRRDREDDFVEHLCRQLLAYALGRSLQLSDESLVAEMKSNLQANQHRFSSLVETIVTSPAFRNKRVQLASVDSAPSSEPEPSP
ncbi:DUF1592 domain-containing protein [Rhodopirellula sp. P2]|uniref:DUF1592 domain-containing protein n=1 Tax=Rhodopirellula sp. P2 TaxID=2127060 RepID=UPI0023683CB5|nr:DUF1592 domain-containing protein [Rhodopirellula sp. P2]WDQ16865.1 DUF1592 domain-containing protein [Rhodopirellula sp. P2]